MRPPGETMVSNSTNLQHLARHSELRRGVLRKELSVSVRAFNKRRVSLAWPEDTCCPVLQEGLAPVRGHLEIKAFSGTATTFDMTNTHPS